MIRINLLPPEEKARIKEVQLTLPAFGDVVIPVAVVVLVAGAIGGTAVVQNMRMNALTQATLEVDEQSRALQPMIERVNRLAQERAELDLRLGIIDKLEQGRTRTVRVIDEAAKCMPNYLWFSSLAEEEDKLVVEGAAYSLLAVSDFMSRLDQSPLFADVELESAERSKQGESDVMKFQVSCRVTPEARAQ